MRNYWNKKTDYIMFTVSNENSTSANRSKTLLIPVCKDLFKFNVHGL